MKAVYFDQPGGPENLYLKELPTPQPKDGEVLINVFATALNRADLLQRKGMYPPPKGESEVLELEATGTVVGHGHGCKGIVSLGSSVMVLLAGGGYGEYVTAPEEQLMTVPSHMIFCQAAAIPEAWLTAYQLLHFGAKVQKGDVVLIHAGASGVGTAVIQLTLLAGAVPIVTAGTPEKLRICAELGAAAGFNYKEEDFLERATEFTRDKGVDIILDCVGGSYWEKNVKCLAMDGRWVLYGLMVPSDVRGDILKELLFKDKRGSIRTSLLRLRSLKHKEELVKAFTADVLPHFEPEGLLQPIIDCIFPMDKIADAHRRMECNRNIGKIIIEVKKERSSQP
ncbi:LOW QUALITY PROTEIN: quinone oxidoreductase PIG3 [Callorhinchus milii]|uniref:LOW QUALITY PROTEIN: quinone oxidoreductase PIG3 n=1 Tax=Callorhinchus milii TaxID=7868 RepID=UPI001C3FD981|nr:LOW QUALITY PROTEIN: quinone oxidoreductase PIG3 [Callorhinchus milii]